MSKRVIAYTRVSTIGQASDGAGLDLQLEKIRAHAQARGMRISRIYREVHSGVGADSIANRQVFQKALARGRKTRQPVLVASLDRVGRDEKSVNALLAYPDVTIISVENGEQADSAVIAAQARHAERTANVISKTTKASLKVKKKEGVRLGNRTNLPEAQRLGAQANRDRCQKRAEEYLSLLGQIDPANTKTRKQIVETLNKRGLKTDRGKPWTAGNFRRLHEETAPERGLARLRRRG